MDDALLAADVFFGLTHVHIFGLRGHLGWQFVHQIGQAAHGAHLLNLREEIVQVKVVAAFDFVGQFLGGRHIDARGDLLDQGQDIAHAQHALCVAVGVEQFQAIHFFARTRELDGHTGDLTHRQSRTTA